MTWRIWRERLKGLRRFREAQDAYVERPGEVIVRTMWDEVVYELSNGRKHSHWIWFVFPQPVGLGRSENSRIFALTRREAGRYWCDPVLRRRLLMATGYIRFWTQKAYDKRTVEQILGELDAMKFRSCMALFHEITGDERFAGWDSDERSTT